MIEEDVQEASPGDLDEGEAPDGFIDGQELAGKEVLSQVTLSSGCCWIRCKLPNTHHSQLLGA